MLRAGLAALALGMASSANAAVTYNFFGFSSQGSRPYGNFSFTTATFLPVNTVQNPTTFLPLAQQSACSVISPAFGFTCGTHYFQSGALNTQIGFATAEGTQTNYIFAAGVLQAVGSYASSGPPPGQPGSQFAGLTVTSDVMGGVPEPASWALMIAGFGLVGGAMRRRAQVRVAYA